MNQGSRKARLAVGLGLFTLVLHFSFAARAAESLNWRKDKDSVDADISSWSLLRTLESISEATGWQVYVEPGTRKNVSTKFKERPRDRALDLLLGNLGRALLPGTNGGPARLLVFRSTQRDATRLIRGRGKAKPIPNELIVRMKKGKNVVLVKILQNEQKEEWAQDWDFKLRVCDATGTAVLSKDRPATKPKAAADKKEQAAK